MLLFLASDGFLVKYRPDKVYDSAESLLTSMKRLLESVQILVPPIFSYSKYWKVIQNIEKMNNLPAHIEIFWFLLKTLQDWKNFQDRSLLGLQVKLLVVQSVNSLWLPVNVRIGSETFFVASSKVFQCWKYQLWHSIISSLIDNYNIDFKTDFILNHDHETNELISFRRGPEFRGGQDPPSTVKTPPLLL